MIPLQKPDIVFLSTCFQRVVYLPRDMFTEVSSSNQMKELKYQRQFFKKDFAIT